jgi:DNA-binding transcriptional LysR family regulator
LEDWAGFSLVDRRSRPVRLTPAGEQILDVALSSFKRLADERNILQQSNLMADRYVVPFCRPAFGGLAVFSLIGCKALKIALGQLCHAFGLMIFLIA